MAKKEKGMDNTLLRERLGALAEPGFQSFTSRLLPGVTGILGVRLPALRQIAREIVRGDWRAYLAGAQDASFEEVMLQGLVLGYAKMPLAEQLERIAAFVPKIGNWSVCDCVSSSLKQARTHPAEYLGFLLPYCADGREFHARFGTVMLLDHFINEAHIDAVLAAMDTVRQPGYYAQMAVAWAVSICYVKFPARTMAYLGSCALRDDTFNTALQKACESYRVSEADKAALRAMKRGRGRLKPPEQPQ